MLLGRTAAAAGALEFVFRPLVALLGIAANADEGVAGIQCQGRGEDDEEFHGVDFSAGNRGPKVETTEILSICRLSAPRNFELVWRGTLN